MEEGTGRAARPPRRPLKYALLAAAAVILAIGGAIAYLLATFDPLDHRERIVAFVQEKTGRTLQIKGDVELSFWPDVAVRLGALELSERGSDEPFASIESARARLDLVPLLSRELVASEIVLSGANVRITRYEDGRLNIDDLLQGEGGAPQFDIGRVKVERSSIAYHDLASGTHYVLADIEVKTGRLANGVTTPVSLAFSARDAKDTFALKTVLEGRMKLDLAAKRYALEAASVGLAGRVPGMADLTARAAGSVAYARETNALEVSALTSTLAGTYGHDAIALALDAASLRAVTGELVVSSLRMTLRAKGAAGTTEVKLASASVARSQDRVAADAVSAELALERGGHRVHAALAAKLDAEIAARKLSLSNMAADFEASGPRLPRRGLSGALKGEARLDLEREGIQTELAGKVAGSTVKARLTAAGFASPVYTFAVELDRLDLDRYLADTGARTKSPQKAASAPGAGLLDPIADLPASGTLRIGVLEAASGTASNVKLVLK